MAAGTVKYKSFLRGGLLVNIDSFNGNGFQNNAINLDNFRNYKSIFILESVDLLFNPYEGGGALAINAEFYEL
ncbi:unnamed protein product, partial [marine sediment metagenome]